MDERQEYVFKLIMEEYLRCAEPIGSKCLSEKYALEMSPATVRSVMAALEQAGYLRHPHTSAGRVPTEKGFMYYLQHFVHSKKSAKGVEKMQEDMHGVSGDEAIKTLAKTLVDLSGETAIVAFDKDRSYYTGVANLFQKPEFAESSAVQALSELVDRFDDVIKEIFSSVSNDPNILIGSKNPFGKDMAAILVRYVSGRGQSGLLGIIGPMRMDYESNISLLEWAKEVLEQPSNNQEENNL